MGEQYSTFPPSRHDAVSAWFLGPRAENADYLVQSFKRVVEEQRKGRQTFYDQDQDFISAETQSSALFQAQNRQLEEQLCIITAKLNEQSIPFYSPRYNAHMSMEMSLPATIGYLTGLLHNQNNVALEGGLMTSILEADVGNQFCKMLGFNTNPQVSPIGWGHITSGGSVANLEAIWAARNLKFYPLSLSWAISEGKLPILKESRFEIELCNGTKKLFMDCSTWELLNLKPSTILGLSDRLAQEYGISQTALTAAMTAYLVQSTGKDALEKKFDIKKPGHLLAGATKHYSWPKGGAIAGIGSAQVKSVAVDLQARMDIGELKKMLDEALKDERPIYGVVAIMGSTEHGACDPLEEIVDLRDKFHKRGLSFVIHCDGAWGAYFASMITKEGKEGFQNNFVPSMALSEYTERQLRSFKDADSITIDPHKSGYCPYPAGGLCYRDGRMRFLVTWTSPVVFREGDVINIGVYGVEGSKPGAAAVGTYLSHQVLGLNPDGLGTLLGEAVFTAARWYCHWAAMETKPVPADQGTKARLIVRPLTMLPSEINGSQKEIDEQREFIRTHILNIKNEDLVKDKKATDLIKQLGGDLMINAFACNFEIDGKVNEDVIEANYLNARIFQELSITKLRAVDKGTQKLTPPPPLILTSSTMASDAYGECLKNFKRRLGLEVKEGQDLYILINVTMSPWPTQGNFLGGMADKFRETAEKLMVDTVKRNVSFPDAHGFVLQGVDKIYGTHVPMFNMEPHRHQLIISCDFPEDVMKIIRERKEANPHQFLTFGNTKPGLLLDIYKDGASFDARLDVGIPSPDDKPIIEFQATNVKIHVHRSLHHRDLDTVYPTRMPFYAYGSGDELHIDHVLSVSPNIQLASERVKILESKSSRSAAEMIAKEGAWIRLTQVYESAIQPLLWDVTKDAHTSYVRPGLRFVPGEKFAFEGFASESEAQKADAVPAISGTLALGPSVYADGHMLNEDPALPPPPPPPKKLDADDTAAMPEGGGLVPGYPTPGASLEAQHLYQARLVQQFKDNLVMSRADAAQEILANEPSQFASETPDWLQAWIDAGEKLAARTEPTPPRHYYGASM